VAVSFCAEIKFLSYKSLVLQFHIVHHNVENFNISFFHAHAAYIADTLDGIFNIILDDTVTAGERTAKHAHLVTKNCRVNC